MEKEKGKREEVPPSHIHYSKTLYLLRAWPQALSICLNANILNILLGFW